MSVIIPPKVWPPQISLNQEPPTRKVFSNVHVLKMEQKLEVLNDGVSRKVFFASKQEPPQKTKKSVRQNKTPSTTVSTVSTPPSQ